MLPIMPAQASKQERQLTNLFNKLDDANKKTLLAFAAFLQTQANNGDVSTGGVSEPIATEPVDIPRPEGESVIKAIKRLTAIYPMVDKETILHPITDLMTSHMIKGRKAPEVIDELETVFHGAYEALKNS